MVICVSCNDVKKQGSLRFYMLSALVHIFHALHSLWVTLFPFALLWWNAMLYATCAKYYSWNRSLLRLQTAGRRCCSYITLESEASFADETEKCPFADASHTENIEMSIFSLLRQAACANAAKRDVDSTPLQHRKSHGFGISIQSFPHQNGFHMLDRYGDVAAACLENSGPQFEEGISCETTSLSSNAQVIAASSRASKLSSLCFQSQPSGLLKSGQWATCSFLLPHQVPPLDFHLCPQIPLKYSCLQVYLHRNGNMLDLKIPMLIDHASIYWPMLREWLQTFNGGYVPILNCGKKHSDLACNSTKLLASQTRNDNNAVLQFILSATEGFNIFNTISSYDALETLKLRIGEQWSSWDLSGFKMKRNISYVDNEGSASDHSEDLDSVCYASIKSDDGCDGMYSTGAESTMDRDDGFEVSGVAYRKQCYRDECGYCCYNFYCSYEDSGLHNAEDSEEANGSFANPTMDKEDSFSDFSADWNEGYNGLTDVDGFGGMDYDAADGDYNNFDGNFEDSGAVCGDFHFPYDDGVYENPLEIRQIHVAKSNTWWDDDAVLVAEQESEEDSIEQEWEVV